MKSMNIKRGGQNKQQQQQSDVRLMFDLSKIPDPDIHPQRQPRRAHNESLTTCPLTVSQLTTDGASVSIRSSGSTADSSQMSQPPGSLDNSDRLSSGLLSGTTSSYQMTNQESEAAAPCFANIKPCGKLGHRESSAGEPSWPADSPDPLCATARGSFSSRSPPDSPKRSGEDSSQTAPAAEIQALPTEDEKLANAEDEIRRAAPSRSSSSSSHSLYMPVRRRQRMSRSLTFGSSRSNSQSSAVDIPTKTEDASHTFTQQRRQSHRKSSKSMNVLKRRSSFSTPLYPLYATCVFVDLEGYSKGSDNDQRQMTRDFMNTLRSLLTFAYGEMPVRGNIDNYVILPTGDGAAVIVIKPPRREIGEEDKEEQNNYNNNFLNQSFNSSCEGLNIDENSCCGHGIDCTHIETGAKKDMAQNQLPQGISCSKCEQQSLRTTEETALWIGSSLLLWASTRHIGLRVGLNSGELSIVEDPYGDPNVCGDAINMAARIMDTALPGQILASASTVVPNLNVLIAEELAAEDLIGAYEDLDVEDDIGLDDSKRLEDIFDKRDGQKGKDCAHCPRIKYEIAAESNEVVVKHGVTANVQSITCQLHLLPRPGDLPEELLPNPLPPTSEAGHSSAPDGGEDVPQPLHPMAGMRSNPKKQSFASLSSLQPAGGSDGSLRGSLRSSLRPSRKDSGMDSGTNSNSEHIPSSARRNSSWKLGESFTRERGMTAMTRMSQISQLSNDDVGASFKTHVTSNLSSEHGLPLVVGNHRTPATKWYMKIKPTEMQSKGDQIKPKVLPQELIRRHHRIAFLGIMHDNLSKGFVKILETDPGHRWEQVYILFPSDSCLRNNLAKNYRDQPVEKLIANKLECHRTLKKLLSQVVDDLRFLQYDQLMHCGSYWDWRDPGGFIHVSPVTWGANPKTCPAMNYYWNSRQPSPEYRVYRDGLDYLLDTAKGFDDEDLADTVEAR